MAARVTPSTRSRTAPALSGEAWGAKRATAVPVVPHRMPAKRTMLAACVVVFVVA
jgi:hypothetical protein